MNRSKKKQKFIQEELFLDNTKIEISQHIAPKGYVFAKGTIGGNWAVYNGYSIDYISKDFTTLLRGADAHEVEFVDEWEKEWQLLPSPYYEKLKVLTHYKVNASIAQAQWAGACSAGIINFIRKFLPEIEVEDDVLENVNSKINFTVIVPKEDLTHVRFIENFCEPIYS